MKFGWFLISIFYLILGQIMLLSNIPFLYLELDSTKTIGVILICTGILLLAIIDRRE